MQRFTNMVKNTLLIVHVLLFILQVACAAPGKVTMARADRVVSQQAAMLPAESRKSANLMLNLPSASDTVEKRTAAIAGATQIRYQQHYKGIPVYGSVITLEKDSTGSFNSDFGVGEVVHGLAQAVPNTKPRLTSDQAFNIALADSAVENGVTVSNKESKLMIYISSDSNKGPDRDARLAYQIGFFYENPRGEVGPDHMDDNVHLPRYFIDAMNGEILDSWDQLANIVVNGIGGTVKTGSLSYTPTTTFGGVDVNASTALTGRCLLANSFVKTRDYTLGGTGADVVFDCATGVAECSAAENGTCNGGYSPLNDAHYAVTKAFQMTDTFLAKYSATTGITSTSALLTNSAVPVPLELRVHVGNGMENALFDGLRISFGDGLYYYHPLTSLDVSIHEFGHVLTKSMSQLEYREQAGGLNEAFSDITAETGEAYVKGTNDWLIGKDVVKSCPTCAMRSLADPPSQGNSIVCATDFKSNMPVHVSSGVINKAFYNLSQRTGWDINKAYLVFLYANDLLWGPRETFASAALKLRQASSKLGFGTTDVASAFKSVCINIECNNVNKNARIGFYKKTGLAATEGTYINPLNTTFLAYPTTFTSTSPCTLRVTITSNIGDADLFIRKGAKPTNTVYDYAAAGAFSNDVVEIPIQPGAQYYFTVYATKAYSQLKFQLDDYGVYKQPTV